MNLVWSYPAPAFLSYVKLAPRVSCLSARQRGRQHFGAKPIARGLVVLDDGAQGRVQARRATYWDAVRLQVIGDNSKMRW